MYQVSCLKGDYSKPLVDRLIMPLVLLYQTVLPRLVNGIYAVPNNGLLLQPCYSTIGHSVMTQAHATCVIFWYVYVFQGYVQCSLLVSSTMDAVGSQRFAFIRWIRSDAMGYHLVYKCIYTSCIQLWYLHTYWYKIDTVHTRAYFVC